MSRLLAGSLLFALLCATPAALGARDTITPDSPVILAYVRAQEALAADDLSAAQAALRDVAAHAPADIKPLAEKAAAETELALVRRDLKPLSDALIARFPDRGDFAVAFCPMADQNRGASWIQKKGQVANPYFGSAMLRCGEFK